MTMSILKRTCAALLFCLLCAGCGSKGDLYLPERAYPQPAQDSK